MLKTLFATSVFLTFSLLAGGAASALVLPVQDVVWLWQPMAISLMLLTILTGWRVAYELRNPGQSPWP